MERSKVRRLIVPPSAADQRLDNFIARTFKDLPKARIYRLIRRGEVRVNRGRVAPSHRLSSGDEVRIPPLDSTPRKEPASASTQALSALEGTILHETPHLIVFNKPSGLAVHGGSGVRLGLIETLRQSRPHAPYLELAHRLDRETSGCLIIAKRRSVLRRLHEALRERSVNKTYLCVVQGLWRNPDSADAPLRKLTRGQSRSVQVDRAGGKPALTFFEPLDHWANGQGEGTLLRVALVTGRTHQIRVHAANAGHPLAGDERYGTRRFNRTMASIGLRRLFLHAEKIELPASVLGEKLVVHAPLTSDLEGVLHMVGCGVPKAENTRRRRLKRKPHAYTQSRSRDENDDERA